jgi:hypothetical protein
MILSGCAETEVRAKELGINPAEYHQTRGGRFLALGELAEDVYTCESRAACGLAYKRGHVGALPELLGALDKLGLHAGCASDIRFALNQGGTDNAEALAELVGRAHGELVGYLSKVA